MAVSPVYSAALRALVKMSAEERAEVLSMAEQLVERVHGLHPKAMFGNGQAVELLACLGIWLARRKAVTTKDTKDTKGY
jgi:hypothetical protein